MAKPPVKAKQLANALAEQIRSGEFDAGGWLPSERDLAAQHVVGRSTVRRALSMLVEEGLAEDLGTGGMRVRSGGEQPQAVGGLKGTDSAKLQDLERRLRIVEERLDRLTVSE